MKPIVNYEFLHAWSAVEADLLKIVVGVAIGLAVGWWWL